MKYWIVTYDFNDGEHEYSKKGIIETEDGEDEESTMKKFEKVHLADMWGDATTYYDDAYWSPSQDVCVHVRSCREISKRDFNVLAKYHLAYRYNPKPVKVNFT